MSVETSLHERETCESAARFVAHFLRELVSEKVASCTIPCRTSPAIPCAPGVPRQSIPFARFGAHPGWTVDGERARAFLGKTRFGRRLLRDEGRAEDAPLAAE